MAPGAAWRKQGEGRALTGGEPCASSPSRVTHRANLTPEGPWIGRYWTACCLGGPSPPTQRVVFGQFLRFGIVGAFGFLIDTAIVYSLRRGLGIYGSGVVAYIAVATINWAFNRVWTFRGYGSGAIHRQWAMFMITNLAGFVLNRGTYALLVTFVPLAYAQPVIAVAAGAIAGLFVNFGLSRTVVFR